MNKARKQMFKILFLTVVACTLYVLFISLLNPLDKEREKVYESIINPDYLIPQSTEGKG